MRTGLWLSPEAVTGDGLVAGPLLDDDARPHALVLVDPRTGKVTETLEERRPAKDTMATPQFDSVVADDRYVAWVEGTPKKLFADWGLFLHDRRTGRTEGVAAARPDTGCGMNGADLFLAEGRLWWTACDSGKGDAAFAVFTADLADHEPEPLRENAVLLGLGDDGESFVRDVSGDGKGEGNLLLDAKGEAKETVLSGDPQGFAADAALSVTEVTGPENGLLRLRHGAYDLALPHQTGFPASVEGPFAAWAATALRLPGAPASVVLTGSHLLWTTGQNAPVPSAAPDEIIAVSSLADTVHLLPLSALAS